MAKSKRFYQYDTPRGQLWGYRRVYKGKLLRKKGFSTKSEVSETSGRGVGLDVVKTTIEELGGSITVSSEPRKGSSFTIRVRNPR